MRAGGKREQDAPTIYCRFFLRLPCLPCLLCFPTVGVPLRLTPTRGPTAASPASSAPVASEASLLLR